MLYTGPAHHVLQHIDNRILVYGSEKGELHVRMCIHSISKLFLDHLILAQQKPSLSFKNWSRTLQISASVVTSSKQRFCFLVLHIISVAMHIAQPVTGAQAPRTAKNRSQKIRRLEELQNNLKCQKLIMYSNNKLIIHLPLPFPQY